MNAQGLRYIVKAMEFSSFAIAALLFMLAIFLSIRQRRTHPVLLVCIGTLSFFWIESPFDWASYAQFHPDLVRMPDIGPWPHTWQGLPLLAPVGYVMYFTLPSLLSVGVAKAFVSGLHWRKPQALLAAGFICGTLWAIAFDHLSAWVGFYRFACTIPGLSLHAGTLMQEALNTDLAMGVQVSVIAYFLGLTDAAGRSVLEIWAASKTRSPLAAGALAIIGAVGVMHLVYLTVLTPHLIAKVAGLNTICVADSLFPGIPNQPF